MLAVEDECITRLYLVDVFIPTISKAGKNRIAIKFNLFQFSQINAFTTEVKLCLE